MEMCPSTVWHLVFHYFDWCEWTINAMFTLWTLLGCVYVQPLTYEDASACITLTLSPRLLTNVLLKTRSQHVLMFFLRRRIYIPFCHMRLMSVSHTFQLLLLERITFDIQGSVVYRHVLLWKMCMRTRPCKSKCCVEERLFTVNTHHSASRRSNQCSQTWFRTWKSCTLTRVRKLCRAVVHRFDYDYGKFDDKHGVICYKLRIDMSS